MSHTVHAGARSAIVILLVTALSILLLSDPGITGPTRSLPWSDLSAGLGANAVLAAVGWRVRAVTPAGAAAGAIIGTAIAVGSSWMSWWVLVAMFTLVVAATRAGRLQKRLSGIEETRQGRRGAGNAIANAGLAAAAACVEFVTGSGIARLAVVAALVTSGSDTVASEIGKAWGRPTWHLLERRRVAAGTVGGISLVGLAAGVASAAALSAFAVSLGLIPPTWAVGVVVAAMFASVIEGLLASVLEVRGMVTNDDVNLLNGLIGVALAVGWRLFFG